MEKPFVRRMYIHANNRIIKHGVGAYTEMWLRKHSNFMYDVLYLDRSTALVRMCN